MVKEGSILIQALVSEKATELQEKQNCYIFKVARNANKLEIKEAVEKGFNEAVHEGVLAGTDVCRRRTR